jgi:hypothetical protein
MPADAMADALIESFRRAGCAVIRGGIAPWIGGVRAGADENMRAPSFRERPCRPADGRSLIGAGAPAALAARSAAQEPAPSPSVRPPARPGPRRCASPASRAPA